MTKRKGKRNRYRKATDAQEQLESIEKEQTGFRRGEKKQRIRSIKKSKQRFENANRNLKTKKDFEDEYD